MDVVPNRFKVADIGSYTVADEYDTSLGFVLIDDNIFVKIRKGRLEAGCYDLRSVFEADELALSVNRRISFARILHKKIILTRIQIYQDIH